MSTKNSQGRTVYRTITQGKTQRATAEAIYDHLIAHRKDIPTGLPPGPGIKPRTVENLTFRLAGSGAACIQFDDYNGLSLSVWPASATNIQVERGWTANWGDYIGRGCLIDNPHADRFRVAAGNPTHDREEVIRLIRIAIGRTRRYHAKEAARVEARAEARARKEGETGPGVPLVPATEKRTLIHLHTPGNAAGLDAAIDALIAGGVAATVHREGDSYFEWGESISTDPDDDDTTHVVIEVAAEHAAAAYGAFAHAGILVDATLAEDWSSRVTWGLGVEPDGWFSRYGDRISL